MIFGRDVDLLDRDAGGDLALIALTITSEESCMKSSAKLSGEPEDVSTALIAAGSTLGGVVLGWLLQAWSSKGARAQEREDRRDDARREHEVKVFSAFQGIHGDERGQKHMEAFNDWSEGWVAYGPRIGDAELGERYMSVATMLMDLIDAEQINGEERPSTLHVVEAIRNARAALAHFIRDQGELPPSSFPNPRELVELLNEGERDDDRLGPLRKWQQEQRANAVLTLPTPSSAVRPPKNNAEIEQ